ncbi:phage portal protein [Variovorax paradoxus]|uniref:phage portal protein n=1 Tax=Variovorax paradoxus TaxID=34073 RepID=UPI0019330C98|nr:phage portal protein [Variovorax paradoxus]
MSALGISAQSAPEPGSVALQRIAVEMTGGGPVEIYDAVRAGNSNPQSGAWWPTYANDAGVHVTHGIAFMQAAVWACIDVIASALASSDWNVYAGLRGADDKKVIPEDRLQYVLNTRFNPEMTAQAGKRAMGIAAAGYGNGIAEIEWDMAGRLAWLWPIAPDRVELVRNRFGSLVYRVTQTSQGGFVDLDPEDVFHIRGASLTGLAGDDMVSKAVKTIARSVAVDQFASSYFANGTQLGGVLEYPNKLDDPTFERLKQQINDKHQGARNAFRTLFLEAGGKFTQFNADADKSQLVDVKNQLIEEVCRWFRVPPHKIAFLLRATNNNIEHQGLEFSRDTLRPWVQEIQQESDYKFFSARGPKKFVELDVDWAEQGDFGSRMTAYSTGRAMGVYSVNDVLRKLGENTIGPVGDVRTMNGAAVRLEDVGKNMLPAAPAPAPASVPAANAGQKDGVAQAWLTSVYARIQRRFDNRKAAAGFDAALHDARSYAAEQVGEMAEALGSRLLAAQKQAIDMVSSPLLPADAAAAVFTKEAA